MVLTRSRTLLEGPGLLRPVVLSVCLLSPAGTGTGSLHCQTKLVAVSGNSIRQHYVLYFPVRLSLRMSGRSYHQKEGFCDSGSFTLFAISLVPKVPIKRALPITSLELLGEIMQLGKSFHFSASFLVFVLGTKPGFLCRRHVCWAR